MTHEELRAALRRGRLLGRRPDRPAARDPGRGPAGLVGGDGVRRLVQRPPRLPGARVRPLARARGRDRERKRRARRRADARADAGGARADGHDRRGDRGDQRAGVPGDPRRRPARPVQAAWTPVEVGELGELAGADIVVDPAELELDPASAAELAAAPPTVQAQRRAPARLRGPAAGRQAAPDPAPLPRLAGRDPRRRKVEAIELVRNELVDGRAVATDERETIPCGIVFRSVGYRGVALPGVPFDEARARSRTRAAGSSPGSTPRAGSSAARAA